MRNGMMVALMACGLMLVGACGGEEVVVDDSPDGEVIQSQQQPMAQLPPGELDPDPDDQCFCETDYCECVMNAGVLALLCRLGMGCAGYYAWVANCRVMHGYDVTLTCYGCRYDSDCQFWEMCFSGSCRKAVCNPSCPAGYTCTQMGCQTLY